LIDFIIQTHPAYAKVQALAEEKSSNVFDILEAKLEDLKKERGCDTSSMLSFRSGSGGILNAYNSRIDEEHPLLSGFGE
jgi:hypothetical protein